MTNLGIDETGMIETKETKTGVKEATAVIEGIQVLVSPEKITMQRKYHNLNYRQA